MRRVVTLWGCASSTLHESWFSIYVRTASQRCAPPRVRDRREIDVADTSLAQSGGPGQLPRPISEDLRVSGLITSARESDRERVLCAVGQGCSRREG